MKGSTPPYKSHFYRKVLGLLFLGISFLMVLISFGTFYIYFRYYVNTLADYALQNSAYVRANLDTQLQDAMLVTDNMYLDSEIQHILTKPSGENQALFQKHYYYQKFSNPYFVCQIDLFDFYGNRYVYYNSGALAHSFWAAPGALGQEWTARVRDAGGRMLWTDGAQISPGASHLLFAMRLIKNVNSNQPVGIAVISLLKRSVSDSLSNYASSTTEIYLADGSGQLVLAQNAIQTPAGESVQLLDMSLVTGREGYYTSFSGSAVTVYSLDPRTQWYVVQVTQLPTFFLFLRQLAGSMPVIFGIVLGVVGLFSYFLYRTLSRPILTLVECMRSLETLDFTPPDLDVTRTDEIGYLNRGYLLMLEELHRLFQNLVQEQNAKKSAELQALRAQINPHFLYNTLTVVRFLIDMNQNQSASEVLICLIKLLKINLDPKREMLTVEEELEYLKSYLLIQKHRYDNFDIVYDIDPQALKCSLPRLLIQPLVENSLFHGLKNGEIKGSIEISLRRTEHTLAVAVRDSGTGFSQDVDLTSPGVNVQRNSASIGLQNVNDRLRLRYGPDSALRIESTPGKGACVSFEIPLQEE